MVAQYKDDIVNKWLDTAYPLSVTLVKCTDEVHSCSYDTIIRTSHIDWAYWKSFPSIIPSHLLLCGYNEFFFGLFHRWDWKNLIFQFSANLIVFGLIMKNVCFCIKFIVTWKFVCCSVKKLEGLAVFHKTECNSRTLKSLLFTTAYKTLFNDFQRFPCFRGIINHS